MDNFVERSFVNYGDAQVSFYNIELQSTEDSGNVEHRHCYFEVHIAEDSYTLMVGQQSIDMPKGKMIIIPPDTVHTTKLPCGKKKPTVLSMSFERTNGNKRFYDNFLYVLYKNALVPISAQGLDDVELSALRNSKLYSTMLGQMKLKAVTAEFLYKFFKVINAGDVKSVGRDRDITVLIDNLINKPDMTVKKISEATNYSPRQITRIIKQRYGMTLTEFKESKNFYDSKEQG